MTNYITNDRIQQEFITALFTENADRDTLLQCQKILTNDTNSDTLVSIMGGLDEHTHILRQQIFETVRDNLESFVSLYAGCHQVHERLDEILDQCQQSMDLETTAQQQTISDTLHAYRDTEGRATQNQGEIQVIERIQQWVQEMDECEKRILSSSFAQEMQEVTRCCLSMNEALSKDQFDSSIVTRLLNEKYTQLKNTLITKLQDKMSLTIIYSEPQDQGLTTMQVNPNPSDKAASPLLDIFECFDMLDMLPAEMANVKRTFMKNMVSPLFDHCSNIVISIQNSNTLCLQQQQLQNELLDEHDTNGKNYTDIACQVIQNVDTLLNFVSEQFFGNLKQDKARLFGNLIIPEIFQQLIQKAISFAIPSSAAQLATFDRVAQTVRALNDNCIQHYGFLDSKEPGSIILYINNIDKHFAAKRRDKLLLEGRRVMLRKLYEIEDVKDVDTSTGTLQQYHITQTPKLLSLLLVDTAKEANSLIQQPSSPHAASGYKLFNVVHDLLDLYRAIMPQFHRGQFLSSPQSSLIFRNDCYWLASTLSTDLMLEVKKTNKTELVDTLQEAVDNIRTLGESWFELAMAQWVRVLQNALNQTGKFVGIAENRQRQQDCENAIAQVIDQIRSYAITLRPVISERVYFDLVSRVVDSVLTHLLGDIEDLQDIGADDSHLIAQSLNSLIQLVDVFDTKDQPATEPMVVHRVPSWRKFWFLKDMLDMNLRDIMDHYRRGELFMFEKKELIGLICALFADTDLRASMIEEIQSTDPIRPPVFSPSSSGTSSSIEQQQQHNIGQPQNISITPKMNNLAMVQLDEEVETGTGWGWDDEPIIPQATHSKEEKEEKQNFKLTSPNKTSHLSMQMDDHDPLEEGDGWGLDEDIDDIPIVPPKNKDSDPALSKKSSPLSMQLDDNDKDAEIGWGFDDDEPMMIQQQPEQGEMSKGQSIDTNPSSVQLEEDHRSVGRGSDDNKPLTMQQTKEEDRKKESIVSEKISQLSMQLDDHEESEGWGFNDDEQFAISQQLQQGEKPKDYISSVSPPLESEKTISPSMMDLDDGKRIQVEKNSDKMDKNEERKNKNISQQAGLISSSTLYLMDEQEDEDGGWGDADEDVNLSHVH